jgi:hypothetical protein
MGFAFFYHWQVRHILCQYVITHYTNDYKFTKSVFKIFFNLIVIVSKSTALRSFLT